MTRVKRGMTIAEVRHIWLARSEAKTKTIMGRYYGRRQESPGGFGHEGLGVHGDYQQRVACEKVRLAVTILEKAGIQVTCATIRKVTHQSETTISSYWAPPRDEPPESDGPGDDELGQIIRFPGPGRPQLAMVRVVAGGTPGIRWAGLTGRCHARCASALEQWTSRRAFAGTG